MNSESHLIEYNHVGGGGDQAHAESLTQIETIVRDELERRQWMLAEPHLLATEIAAELSAQNKQQAQSIWNIDTQVVRRSVVGRYSKLLHAALVEGHDSQRSRAYEELWMWIYTRVRTRVDLARDAEDITQETLLQIHRSFSKIGDPSGFLAWVSVITFRNIRSYNFRFKERFQEQLSTSDEVLSDEYAYGDDIVDFDTLMEETAISGEVREAIGHLSKIQQQILLASIIEELPSIEIARQLHITPRSVYVLRYRAISKLRNMLVPSPMEQVP